jgi:peptidyl-prolyl cis-trans isomerase SurA
MTLGRTRRAALVAAAFTAAIAGSALPAPALAQSQLGIVAVVNDQIVSEYDLQQRLQAAITSAGLPDTTDVQERLAPQVLRDLVDERLQVQEAGRLELAVADADVAIAIRNLEQRNNIPEGGFEQFLNQRGLELSVVRTQVMADLAWNQVLRTQIAPNVRISEEEIDEAMALVAASEGKNHLLLSEIVLFAELPAQDLEVRAETARILADIRAGAEFGAVAQQFSHSASALDGGNIGWVLEEQLAPEIAAALAGLPAGAISEPVSSGGGYYIFWLRDRRVIGSASPFDAIVELKQIALPLSATSEEPDVARALARAGSIATTVQGCRAMDAIIQEVGNQQSGDLGRIRIGDMPPRFREVIAALGVGQPSAPVRSDTGIHVLMVCERTEADSNIPERDEVAQSIWNQRFSMLARRYMRDLRREAVIEYR